MRDPDRIDLIIEMLRKVWHSYPDLRLGQLITHTLTCAGAPNLFYMEDDELLVELRKIERDFHPHSSEQDGKSPTSAEEFINDVIEMIKNYRPIAKALSDILKIPD